MPQSIDVEANVAQFYCIGCGIIKSIEFQNFQKGDTLRGVVACASCGGHTVFEMKEHILTFIDSKEHYAHPSDNVPEKARNRYLEASLCFMSLALRAAAIMLRSSLEIALVGKGFATGTLERRIEDAKKAEVMTDIQVSLAHGTRLVGNKAVHEKENPTFAEVLALFGAVTQIEDELYATP